MPERTWAGLGLAARNSISSAAPAVSFSFIATIAPLSSRAIVGGVCGRGGGGCWNGFVDGGREGSESDVPSTLVSDGPRDRPERTDAASTKEEKVGSDDDSCLDEDEADGVGADPFALDCRAELVRERGEPADDGRRGGGETVPDEPVRKVGRDDSAAIVWRRFCRCASDGGRGGGKCAFV